MPLSVRGHGADADHIRGGGLAAAEPGRTMFMISHFHYDPVWWNTQASYTNLTGPETAIRDLWHSIGFSA